MKTLLSSSSYPNMKFSTRAEYGLKAMANLAKCFPDQKSIKLIAKEEKISLKYLERLMGELRKNNLVMSRKGKSGGYALFRKPKEIKAGEIIEILDGPLSPMKCIACTYGNQCSSSLVWLKLGTQIRKTLYAINLNDLT